MGAVAGAPDRPTGHVIQLRVELGGVEPTVWRRVLVPGHVTLDALHRILQTCMGWDDLHLHEFSIGGEAYGVLDDEDDDVLDEVGTPLVGALGELRAFGYLYDFGDEWLHRVVVEAQHDRPLDSLALCLEGANACPPEDVGGPSGYAEFLEAGARGSFDPSRFDVDEVNSALRALG